jgi:hypothetical protein
MYEIRIIKVWVSRERTEMLNTKDSKNGGSDLKTFFVHGMGAKAERTGGRGGPPDR